VCYSNNFIEQQAYEMSEKIRKNSLYKFVRVEYSIGTSLVSQKQNMPSQEHPTTNGLALITKVILKDKDGTIYSVEPSPNGVRFAKGEISYKEYKKLEQRETYKGIATFLVIIGFFIILMFILMKYFPENVSWN
jgi:hypothetical protein